MRASALTTKRERLEAREDRILAAARRVFLQHGYQGAKMHLIASEAGVADGTLYLYYKNKNAIVDAVLRRLWTAMSEDAVKVIASEKQSFDKLRAFTVFHLETLVREWRIVELGYVQRYTAIRPAAGTQAFLAGYAGLLIGILQQGIDRGVFRRDLDVGYVRDLFFGTLEFTARSLLGREDPKAAAQATENHMRVLGKILSLHVPVAPSIELKSLTAELADVTARLQKLT